MFKFIFLLLISFSTFASDWCPDKVAVAPILFKNKVQPLFFVAEDLLKDFEYSYKLRSSTVFCLLSLKHKGINKTVEVYPPIKLQNKLKIILNKKLVSMEDLYLIKNQAWDQETNRLIEKYSKIRNGEYWNIPILFEKDVKWEPLTKLSINDLFAERINQIKIKYVDTFGWDYLYEYYFYIFIRLFIISLLVVGFVYIRVKHNKKQD